MSGPRHPVDVLFAALGQALEAELGRQDGDRRDLPALGGRRRRGRGDLAVLLEAKAKKRRRADQRAPRAA